MTTSNAISYALHIPHSWRDLRLAPAPQVGTSCATLARVISSHQTPKLFAVKLWSVSWQQPINAVFFHAKSWQKAQFSADKELIIYGKTAIGFGGLIEFVQPIVTAHSGVIEPVYKHVTKAFKAAIGELSLDALISDGLPLKVAQELFTLHKPTIAVPNVQSAVVQYALKYAEIYLFLSQLRSKKTTLPSMAQITTSPAPFIRSLPFALTPDQLAAIAACQNDIAKPTQARRLIVGDVGCGKTLVMLAVAFMIGKQKTILMAPTTILASQLFEEAQKYLKPFLSTAIVTQKAETDISSADLIIGTHALLYRSLPTAACVMIDEQHRFGTAQRSKLSAMVSGAAGAKPHFFQFSATPIPRSLAMIQSALLDISAIRTMPFAKQTATSVIGRADFKALLAQITAELSAGNQALIVYPLIEASETNEYQSLEQARGFWETRFDGVVVTHGKDKDKEAALVEFRERGRILLATTVVEVGISLPRLTMVVIVGAERLGLATLHQLRGRVGRAGQKSQCFFYTNHTDNARLRTLAATNDGFEVAEMDLQNRASGDMLDGIIQSGNNFRFFDMTQDIRILEEVKNTL
ncbi:ATP-dependent DNA helicase RecG [Campylobacterota bacterium]|nr:ATP-dependent DNA helicase RecG [Campylobacterota bacterium]